MFRRLRALGAQGVDAGLVGDLRRLHAEVHREHPDDQEGHRGREHDAERYGGERDPGKDRAAGVTRVGEPSDGRRGERPRRADETEEAREASGVPRVHAEGRGGEAEGEGGPEGGERGEEGRAVGGRLAEDRLLAHEVDQRSEQLAVTHGRVLRAVDRQQEAHEDGQGDGEGPPP